MKFSHRIHYSIGISFLLMVLIRLFIQLPIDVWEDHDIALNLLNDGEFYYLNDGAKNYTFQFPLYPSIIALLYKIVGVHFKIACLFNLFIHCVSAYVLVELFKSLINYFRPEWSNKTVERILLISILIFLWHPALVYYAINHVHPFSLNLFMLFSAFYFVWNAAMNPVRRNQLTAGIIIGLAMYDRATVVVTMVPFIFLSLKQNGSLKTIKNAALITSISLLVVSPWLIRNYSVDGIIGFESSAAKNSWKGVLKNSDGGNFLTNGETYYAALSTNELDSLGRMNSIQQRDFFHSKYMEIVTNEPGHVIAMFFVKLKNFWWFRPNTGEELGKLKSFLSYYKIGYGIVLCGIVLLLICFPKKTLLVLSFPLALSFLQAYFYVEMRHRIIIEPLLIFMAILAVSEYIYRRTATSE